MPDSDKSLLRLFLCHSFFKIFGALRLSELPWCRQGEGVRVDVEGVPFALVIFEMVPVYWRPGR